MRHYCSTVYMPISCTTRAKGSNYKQNQAFATEREVHCCSCVLDRFVPDETTKLSKIHWYEYLCGDKRQIGEDERGALQQIPT